MEYVTLNNGIMMPILGFGVYQIPDAEVCERSVLDAMHTDYHMIEANNSAFLNHRDPATVKWIGSFKFEH